MELGEYLESLLGEWKWEITIAKEMDGCWNPLVTITTFNTRERIPRIDPISPNFWYKRFNLTRDQLEMDWYLEDLDTENSFLDVNEPVYFDELQSFPRVPTWILRLFSNVDFFETEEFKFRLSWSREEETYLRTIRVIEEEILYPIKLEYQKKLLDFFTSRIN